MCRVVDCFNWWQTNDMHGRHVAMRACAVVLHLAYSHNGRHGAAMHLEGNGRRITWNGKKALIEAQAKNNEKERKGKRQRQELKIGSRVTCRNATESLSRIVLTWFSLKNLFTFFVSWYLSHNAKVQSRYVFLRLWISRLRLLCISLLRLRHYNSLPPALRVFVKMAIVCNLASSYTAL